MEVQSEARLVGAVLMDPAILGVILGFVLDVDRDVVAAAPRRMISTVGKLMGVCRAWRDHCRQDEYWRPVALALIPTTVSTNGFYDMVRSMGRSLHHPTTVTVCADDHSCHLYIEVVDATSGARLYTARGPIDYNVDETITTLRVGRGRKESRANTPLPLGATAAGSDNSTLSIRVYVEEKEHGGRRGLLYKTPPMSYREYDGATCSYWRPFLSVSGNLLHGLFAGIYIPLSNPPTFFSGRVQVRDGGMGFRDTYGRGRAL